MGFSVRFCHPSGWLGVTEIWKGTILNACPNNLILYLGSTLPQNMPIQQIRLFGSEKASVSYTRRPGRTTVARLLRNRPLWLC